METMQFETQINETLLKGSVNYAAKYDQDGYMVEGRIELDLENLIFTKIMVDIGELHNIPYSKFKFYDISLAVQFESKLKQLILKYGVWYE